MRLTTINVNIWLPNRPERYRVDLPASLQATGFPWEFPIAKEVNDVEDSKILQELRGSITTIMEALVELLGRNMDSNDQDSEEV